MFKSTDDYLALCQLFNHRFRNPRMFAKAITRKTAWVSGRQEKEIGHQETLTYLGGDILRAVIDDLLFTINPQFAKGNLSPERDKLIGTNSIAQVAADLNIDDYILMDGSDTGNFRGQGCAKILSDTLKALLAAAFLASGKNYLLVRKFVEKYWAIPMIYSDSDNRKANQDFPKYKYLYSQLGYNFKEGILLARALTRKSAIQEGMQDKAIGHSETLATLGDGVLRMVMSDILLTNKLQAALEEINEDMDRLVSNQHIAIIAERLDLDDYLVIGRGENYNFEREGRNKVLAATVEAIIGAIFLDSDRDYRLTKGFIAQHWELIEPRQQPASNSEPRRYRRSSTNPHIDAEQPTSTSYSGTSSRNSSHAMPGSSTGTRYYRSKDPYVSKKTPYMNKYSARYQPDSDSSSSDEDNGPGLGTALAIGGLFALGAVAAYHYTKEDKTEASPKPFNEEAKKQQKAQAKQEDDASGCMLS